MGFYRGTKMKTFTQFITTINEKAEYKLLHDTYTSAIDEALEYAKVKGYDYSTDETFDKIGNGPKKPSEGKTNRFTIELTKNNKPVRQALHIQVYGMKNKYELNCYIS